MNLTDAQIIFSEAKQLAESGKVPRDGWALDQWIAELGIGSARHGIAGRLDSGTALPLHAMKLCMQRLIREMYAEQVPGDRSRYRATVNRGHNVRGRPPPR